MLQHFELLPESALLSAQSSLLSTLTPELHSLLSRVESHLDRMARREQTLIAQSKLQAGRLTSLADKRGESLGREFGDDEDDGGEDGEQEEGDKEVDVGVRDLEREREMKRLRQKKERLASKVGLLMLQARQRERELRKSMAAQ